MRIHANLVVTVRLLVDHYVVDIGWHHLGCTAGCPCRVSWTLTQHTDVAADTRWARRQLVVQLLLLLVICGQVACSYRCKAIVGAHFLKPLLQIVMASRNCVWFLVNELWRVVLQVLQTQTKILDALDSLWGDHHLVIGWVAAFWRRRCGIHTLLAKKQLLLKCLISQLQAVRREWGSLHVGNWGTLRAIMQVYS